MIKHTGQRPHPLWKSYCSVFYVNQETEAQGVGRAEKRSLAFYNYMIYKFPT